MDTTQRDITEYVTRLVDDCLISKYTRNMPIRLVDTYTGLIFERYQIVSMLKMRRDYQEKLRAVIQEASLPADLNGLPPKLSHLDEFIAEFLAFAMLSHRWRGREPTLVDVTTASRGIYSMHVKDLQNEGNVSHPSRGEINELSDGIKKLQEFCCVAAKCGFRWAWSDTCCINKNDFSELSESINSMFNWYRGSDLTIVYLDDVDKIEEAFSATAESNLWFEDTEFRTPLSFSDSSTSHATSQTPPHLSLRDRLRDPSSPQLRAMQADVQVERWKLEDHLLRQFSATERKRLGKSFKLPVWVERGWTLQEMLASKRLRFYSRQWTLLEEAYDPDTDDEEERISISSFKHRARLVDHRAHDIWRRVLEESTGVFGKDLGSFEAEVTDLRKRLGWMLRRTTTKVEDMTYCMLGIFDISLPPMYGEGPRAFFRLQEEIIKRTGDLSLFDWCGRSSGVNSFLAYGLECFEWPTLPKPIIEDSHDSIFHMILNLLLTIFQAELDTIVHLAQSAASWITGITGSPLLGHMLINGELNLPLFEHQVRCCKPLPSNSTSDPHFQYQLEADGLATTIVTTMSPLPDPVDPTQYFLCRIYDRHARKTLLSLQDLISYVLPMLLGGILEGVGSGLGAKDETSSAGSKTREEMQTKRKEVMTFFQHSFVAYLIRVDGGRRVRVSTAERVLVGYTKFDFSMPVTIRLVS